jgi:hypoxanthine phosphoribosyltransferase
MPSGHAEGSTLLFGLLYLTGILSGPICLFIISMVCIQRVVSNMHTIGQVVMGILLGGFYALVYYYTHFSLFSFLFVFVWSWILVALSIYKIDATIKEPIPEWVDPQMIPSIQKKQESPFYLKGMSLFANAFIQEKTFVTWKELELYLDTVVDNIKNTCIPFDAVIGIKTGGAIVSDYLSKELQIPSYKIKLSREEYKCNKKPGDSILDVIYRQLWNHYGTYTLCEGIDDNIKGKNVILIDEMVSSGTTMLESIQYLRKEKQVYMLYPTCIALSRKKYKKDVVIHSVLPKLVFVWPWGYDN